MKRYGIGAPLVMVVLAAMAYACGGVDSELVGPGDSHDSDDANEKNSDAGGARDASISRSDSGASSDAGRIANDAGVIVGSPVVPKVCGTNPDAGIVRCSPSTPICCASQHSGSFVTYDCVAQEGDCAGIETMPILCRDDRDCSGTKVCCGLLASSSDYFESLDCEEPTDCPELYENGAVANFHFCTAGAADSECIATDESCITEVGLPGFSVCN